jgi:hypothetical protein
VLYVFLAVVTLAVFDSTAARILLGTGRVRFDAWVSLSAAALNFGLSLTLVRHYGVVGVALGTLVPAAICNLLVSVPYVCRLTGTRVVPFYLGVLLPVAGIGAAGWLSMLATRAWLESRVAALVVDSLIVALLSGLGFLKNARDAQRGAGSVGIDAPDDAALASTPPPEAPRS